MIVQFKGQSGHYFREVEILLNFSFIILLTLMLDKQYETLQKLPKQQNRTVKDMFFGNLAHIANL